MTLKHSHFLVCLHFEFVLFLMLTRLQTMLDKIETVALPLRSKMSSGSHVAVQDVKYATSGDATCIIP